LIALVMQSSNTIHYFGWVRYYQINYWVEWSSWEIFAPLSPLWFYYFFILTCAFLGWLIITWYRMRKEDMSMSHGQFQEMAVISIGLALLSIPSIVYEMWNYIDMYVLSNPPDLGEAYETMWFYARLSLLFAFSTYMTIGLLAMRRYHRAMPIEVVPLDGPALPPPTDMPVDR
jgi:hypothetical protein